MTLTTRWWWIRHAPVDNPDDRFYGQLDLPADLSDRPALEALGRRLPKDALWLVTPLRRTGETAAALMRAAGTGPVRREVEPALMEQNFGDWQGRTRAEVWATIGPGHPFWLDPAGSRPPDGESFLDLAARVTAAIERWSSTHRGRDIVAVAHGGTVRAALAMALGLDGDKALAFAVDPLSLTRLDVVIGADGPPAWRVGGVNLPPGASGAGR